MTQPLRVVHVVPTLKRGGAETILVRISGATARRFETHIVTFTDECDFDIPDGVNVIELGLRSNRDIVRATRRTRAVLRRLEADAVVGWLYQGGYAAVLASRGLAPAAWSLHHTPWRDESRVASAVLRGGALVSRLGTQMVYCADSSREAHELMGYRRPGIVITNGVDPEVFTRKESARARLRRQWGLSQDEVVIGNLARFDSQKNHAGLIGAFAAVKEQSNKPVQLVMAGRGVDGENQALMACVAAHGVVGDVILLGDRSDAPDLLSAIDIYVQPSHGEAFPVALAEAMASSCACVASDVGDSRRLLGESGWMFASGDQAAFERQLLCAIRLDEESRARVGEDARERVVERFTQTTMVDRYSALMCGITGGGK